MKKPIIILKGRPNSGKSHCLRKYLPKTLISNENKRSIFYKGMWILIIRRSIHESPDWKNVIAKIIKAGYDIIIIAAWSDEFINQSENVNEKIEDLIDKLAKGKFEYNIVHTNLYGSEAQQRIDQQRCSKEIKDIIDKF